MERALIYLRLIYRHFSYSLISLRCLICNISGEPDASGDSPHSHVQMHYTERIARPSYSVPSFWHITHRCLLAS